MILLEDECYGGCMQRDSDEAADEACVRSSVCY